MIADFGLRIADFCDFPIHDPQLKIEKMLASKGVAS